LNVKKRLIVIFPIKRISFIGFARLFTFAYSSSFVLALTELVVSALSGRLYSQSQIQHSSNRDQNVTTTAGGISATSKSSHAEVKIFNSNSRENTFFSFI
jgi:hypothetical protein